jgi:hypothetical protein
MLAMETIATPSAHTPGPWHVTMSENASVYGGEKHFAVMSDRETGGGQIVADLETLKEAEANARLIAAAPEMLDALRIAENAVRDWLLYETPGSAEFQEHAWVLKVIHDCRAKATGRV